MSKVVRLVCSRYGLLVLRKHFDKGMGESDQGIRGRVSFKGT